MAPAASRAGPMRIRRANPDDATVLAALGEWTFRAAFGAVNDPADLEPYVAEAFAVPRLSAELDDPTVTYLVAEAGGEALGYAKLRSGVADVSVTGPEPIELERLYARHPGAGVGVVLLRTCLAVAMESGHSTLWLGVWEENEPAIAFYRREGFELVGRHPFALGSVTQTDLVMARPVAGR